ncbi:acyltransferase family protein [Nesterenkonia halotolerans]|uniref:acyltransferase family protein n=1 Tax=Nesterenkonia halotolerans TaxID=225325 RepID=UPI003EE52197
MSSTASQHVHPSTALATIPPRHYRPELHGLRGLAILGVVLFHLYGNGRVSGGIDVFLAISGFLFTGMLLREAAHTGGKIDLVRYFGRLIRRLLPPALLVIGVTTVAGLIVFPVTRHQQLLTEALASLLYFENLELVNSQLSYEAAGPGSSPFQHFWSLSVQGQFFLIWPIVAIAAVWIGRRTRWSPAMAMLGLTGAVLVTSFLVSLYMGEVHQEAAYLMTRTRLWELAFGGILALLISSANPPRRIRDAAGWTGLFLIVTCGFFLNGAELFPGPWALWPLLGFALILVSADATHRDYERRGTAARFLSTSPMAWIGTLAYGIYLWHWPILIFYLEVRGNEKVSWPGGSFVLVLSLGAAWVTHLVIERPSIRLQIRRQSLIVMTGVLLVFGGSVALTALLSERTPDLPDGYSMAGVDRELFPGAEAILEGEEDPYGGERFFPDPVILEQDEPMYYGWDCRQDSGDDAGTGEVLICEDPNAPAEPTATIMLAGGSHVGQWQHAFALLGEAYGWEIIIADKSGCRIGSIENPDEDKCAEWNLNLPQAVTDREPDLVVTPGTVILSRSPEVVEEGAPDRWEDITDTGADLLLMRGTGRPNEDADECLAEGRDSSECAPDETLIAENNPLDGINLPENTSVVDITSTYICPDLRCDGVIGNLAVYRDGSHLSTYYVETLTPMLEDAMRDSVPELFN